MERDQSLEPWSNLVTFPIVPEDAVACRTSKNEQINSGAVGNYDAWLCGYFFPVAVLFNMTQCDVSYANLAA